MGIYNPQIKEWVRIVHEAGGLCFYDHANFNGVMGKLRARELGFDACMYMLHKTFGAPKGGGGPAVGAYGCTAELAPFLPGPVVVKEGGALPPRPATGRRAPARCASSAATCRRWSRPMPGRGPWAPTASTRPPTSRCSPTTTWTSKLAEIRGLAPSNPDNRQLAHGDDALGPRAAQGGDRHRHRRGRRTAWPTTASIPGG